MVIVSVELNELPQSEYAHVTTIWIKKQYVTSSLEALCVLSLSLHLAPPKVNHYLDFIHH